MTADPVFWLGLGEIVWINLLLSGDNALVIALASRSLPHHLQKWGIILGTVPAVILRVIFSEVLTYLIAIPLIKLGGGVLLVWIAYRLLRHKSGGRADERPGMTATIWIAAWTIIVADAVMSLDNVVAIAAAARGNMVLLCIGLVISMPMVVCGASLLTRLLERFPILVVGGASLLGYIAGELIVGDPLTAGWLARAPQLSMLLPAGIAAALAGAGLLIREPSVGPTPKRKPTPSQS